MTETRKEKNTIDIFNFIRAFALLCVLVTHSRIVISSNLSVFKTPDSFSWLAYTPAWTAMGIFFMLSGYLLGKGFYNKKYTTDISGCITFWTTRLIRILPMYLFFIIITALFINPGLFALNKSSLLIPVLTFTYNGSPGGGGFGALWFVSTIMQLYFCSPIVYKIFLSKIKDNHVLYLCIIILLGFLYRIIAYHFHLDWQKQIYTPSWANLDFFVAGMLLNAICIKSKDNLIKKWLRPLSIISLIALNIYLMLLYYHHQLTFYRYYAPSIIIVLLCIIIYSFDSIDKIYSKPLSLKNLITNPLRIIDIIGILSFGAYLYHSYIFSIIPRLISEKLIFANGYTKSQVLICTYIFTAIALFIWCSIIYTYIEKPANTYRKKININIPKMQYIVNFLRRGGGLIVESLV